MPLPFVWIQPGQQRVGTSTKEEMANPQGEAKLKGQVGRSPKGKAEPCLERRCKDLAGHLVQ